MKHEILCYAFSYEVLPYAFGCGAVVGFILLFVVIKNKFISRSDWELESKLARENIYIAQKIKDEFIESTKKLGGEFEDKRLEINKLINEFNDTLTRLSK